MKMTWARHITQISQMLIFLTGQKQILWSSWSILRKRFHRKTVFVLTPVRTSWTGIISALECIQQNNVKKCGGRFRKGCEDSDYWGRCLKMQRLGFLNHGPTSIVVRSRTDTQICQEDLCQRTCSFIWRKKTKLLEKILVWRWQVFPNA